MNKVKKKQLHNSKYKNFNKDNGSRSYFFITSGMIDIEREIFNIIH